MKEMKFDKSAVVYDSGVRGKASQKFYNLLLQEIRLQPNAVILDVGCGTGFLLGRISNTFTISGYGIDAEEAMILQARKQCPQMQFTTASCDRLPFERNTFDAVIACMAYHHFANKKGFACEAARVLKPGGVLYIVDPRFPWIIRKAMNGILRLISVVGEFYAPREIETKFIPHGFIGLGSATDVYVQVIKLQKKRNDDDTNLQSSLIV